MTRRRLIPFLCFLSVCWPTEASRSESTVTAAPTTSVVPARPEKLKIAVFERPPYSFKNKEGVWTGVSIELWEQIAGQLGLAYKYVEVPLEDVYEKLHAGTCDLSLVLAISSEHLDQVEFTEPYLFSNGAVVTLRKSFLDGLLAFSSYLGTKEVFFILLAMVVGMVFFSLLLVLVERKYDRGHFAGPSLTGFGSALWFSAVTMTTTGYGDKTPTSALGRSITFFWMLVGVLLIALFTGTIASSITTAEIHNSIVRFEDLSRFRVGCIEGSRMDLLLKERGIPATRFAAPEDAFAGFSDKAINAFVGDVVSLEYVMTHRAPGKFKISPIPGAEMIYAFASKPNLPEQAEINRLLLNISLAPGWRTKAQKWTGPLSF